MLVIMLELQVYDKHSSRLVRAVKVLTHHQKLSLEALIMEITATPVCYEILVGFLKKSAIGRRIVLKALPCLLDCTTSALLGRWVFK